jgi:membrane protein DedA with SNARE-associated domain
MLVAAVTDRLVDFAVNVVGDLGLWGIFILMVPESALIPIPSEATMLFAGFNVYEGTYGLWAAVLVGTLANVIGSSIAYAIGYYGRIDLIEKHGKKLHITPHHLELVDGWFQKYGPITVFATRMMPIVRTFVSLPAGVAKMPFWKFLIYTAAGCLPWILMLTLIGRAAGANWEDWKDRLHYVDYAFAAMIIAIVAYFVIRWWRGRGDTPPADGPEAAAAAVNQTADPSSDS